MRNSDDKLYTIPHSMRLRLLGILYRPASSLPTLLVLVSFVLVRRLGANSKSKWLQLCRGLLKFVANFSLSSFDFWLYLSTAARSLIFSDRPPIRLCFPRQTPEIRRSRPSSTPFSRRPPLGLPPSNLFISPAPPLRPLHSVPVHVLPTDTTPGCFASRTSNVKQRLNMSLLEGQDEEPSAEDRRGFAGWSCELQYVLVFIVRIDRADTTGHLKWCQRQQQHAQPTTLVCYSSNLCYLPI